MCISVWDAEKAALVCPKIIITVFYSKYLPFVQKQTEIISLWNVQLFKIQVGTIKLRKWLRISAQGGFPL